MLGKNFDWFILSGMSNKTTNFIAIVIALVSLVLGGGSLLWFGLFLLAGSFSVFDLGLSLPGLLSVNASLSLFFFAQHSIMLRKWFRTRAEKIIPPPYFASFFGISSALALLVVLIGWQESSYVLFSAEGVYRAAFRLLFLVSVAGFLWAAHSLQSFDSFGGKTLLRHVNNRPPKALPLTVQGPYKLVRHPLYFLSLLMIWSSPDISADRMLFNVLWSVWIVIATRLEEKDLVAEFGNEYRNYQKEVPMLIPLKKKGT